MTHAHLSPLPDDKVHEIAVLASSIQDLVNTASTNTVAINAVFAVAAAFCLDVELNTDLSREKVLDLVTAMMRSMMKTIETHASHANTH